MLRKPVEAVLFDMDGLLIDTEAVYIVALQAAARTLGREMPLDFCHSMIGVPCRECFRGFDVGLAAAHAAGAMAFMVPDILPPSPEVLAKCLTVVPNLHAALRLLEAEL